MRTISCPRTVTSSPHVASQRGQVRYDVVSSAAAIARHGRHGPPPKVGPSGGGPQLSSVSLRQALRRQVLGSHRRRVLLCRLDLVVKRDEVVGGQRGRKRV